LPAGVTQRLNAALAESLKAPDLVQRLTASGATIADPGVALAPFQAAEIDKYRRIVQQANIRV
jgi:tripartite-type tricarboxylate transporter receptor subunit TctC